MAQPASKRLVTEESLQSGPAAEVLTATYAARGSSNVFTAEQSVPTLKIGTATDAITITDTVGTHGQRMSVQPVSAATSDRAAQVQLIPGDSVSQDTVTPVIQAQLLVFGRTGTDYERLLVDGRGKEFRITTSKRTAGTQRPLVFYVEDNGVSTTAVASVQPSTLAFRAHTGLEIGNATCTLTKPADGTIQTTAHLTSTNSARAGVGTAQEVRIGNVAGTATAAINFGSTQDAYIIRVGAAHLRTNGKFEIDGDLDHDGTAVGFYGVTPVARATVAAAATDAATTQTLVNDLRAKLVALGLVQ